MKLYKLTDKKNQTQNDTQWGKNITHSIPIEKQSKQLRSDGVLHAYTNLNLALLLNPIHANLKTFNIWEADGDIVIQDWGKCGCHELTTIQKIPVPAWYKSKKTRRYVQIQFAVLCAEAVLSLYEKKHPKDDRPRKAITAAKRYLKEKNSARAAAAAADAARAAADAADAADAAAYAAADAAAYAAAAAAAAADAARAAADAADAADAANTSLNFNQLADKAVKKITGVK